VAQIDVSPFIGSPLFISTPQNRIGVLRSRQNVDANGFLTETDRVVVSITAIVQPASPATIKNLPDGMQVNALIEIWTVTKILPPDNKRSGDILLWQDRRWMVRNVRDWSGWGRGFCHAVAEQIGTTEEPEGDPRWNEFRWDDGSRWG
jgi:hypothetical protein